VNSASPPRSGGLAGLLEDKLCPDSEMIEFITGLPGAGKGVFSVIQIIEELKRTDRPIVTNFAIKLHPWVRRLAKDRSRPEKGLLAYLRDTYGKTFDAEKRIKLISDDEAAAFYLNRCFIETYDLTKIEANRSDKGAIESLDEKAFTRTRPTLYVIDEAWKFWNARDWSKTDKGFQFYNAQHRKAGDDLFITAQHASQIDKQMRVLVEQYHTLVNHRFRKMMVFKQPNVISVVSSNEPPELRNKTLSASPRIIRFDREGIGSCFDTAQGAGGVQGMAADIEKKAKGLPWWGLIVLVAVLGLGLIITARGSGWLTGKLLTGGFQKQSAPVTLNGSTPKKQDPVGSLLGLRVPDQKKDEIKEKDRTQVEDKADEILMMARVWIPPQHNTVNGRWRWVKDKWIVCLSDGHIYESGDGHLQFLAVDYCVVDGRTNKMAPHGKKISTDSGIAGRGPDSRRALSPSAF